MLAGGHSVSLEQLGTCVSKYCCDEKKSRRNCKHKQGRGGGVSSVGKREGGGKIPAPPEVGNSPSSVQQPGHQGKPGSKA